MDMPSKQYNWCNAMSTPLHLNETKVMDVLYDIDIQLLQKSYEVSVQLVNTTLKIYTIINR